MTLLRIAFSAALTVAVLVLAPIALAGKGAAGSSGKADGTFSLVVLDSGGLAAASTVPKWGQQVTFDVTSNVAYPSVELDCYQNGAWVYQQIVGFYPTFVDQTFTLESFYWTGGAADCDATLYTTKNNGSRVTLDTMSFGVSA